MSNQVAKLPNTLDSVPPLHPNRCTIPFPRLPLELREMIYRFAIFPDYRVPCACHIQFSEVDATIGRGPRFPYWLPQICKVNEATRTEVGLFFIRHVKFDILFTANLNHFAMFLNTFPRNHGFDSVRKMDFPLFGHHQPNPGEPNLYIEFLKRCPGLTEIYLKFEVGDFLRVRSYTYQSVAILPQHLRHSSELQIMKIDKIIEIYRLKELFVLANSLNKIIVRVWRRVWIGSEKQMENVLLDCMSEAVDLTEWLKQGFQGKGRSVDVKFVEADTPGLSWRRCS